ncbi:MAG TPA: DinB family protein [Candidatus Nitrosotenuis sp.]|nr:DinB family protein [Candidatus Nitrosotenuis sp.]
MTPDEFLLLYEYDAWANRRLLDAAAKLTPEQFQRDLGSSFPSVRDTLVHIMGAQSVWLDRWLGRASAGLPKAADFPTLESIRVRWRELESELLTFVGGLTPEMIAEVREYRTLSSGVLRNPLWQALQHLVNHGSYHRGQVTTMLRQLGAGPVSTDLIVFYRERAVAA